MYYYHIHVTYDGQGFSVMFQHDEKLERDGIIEEGIRREWISRTDVPDIDTVKEVPQARYNAFQEYWKVHTVPA